MIYNIASGKLMVVSDLHGNGFDFRQIVKVYHQLKNKGKADYLVFLGDLIHAYPGKQKDESLEIVEELRMMKANQQGSDVICLLGNHEFVHIYHIPLHRGHLEFTSWFENRIRSKREGVIRFFMDMPFMIRTKGGVLLNHSGASDRFGKNENIGYNFFRDYHHTGNFLSHINEIRKYNPEIGGEFMRTDEGDFLWDVLMNGNERQYGESYLEMVGDLLFCMSEDRRNAPLTSLVCGHIGADYGAERVGDYQLRLCSSAGCLGDLEKKYLLISSEKEYKDSGALLECCFDLY